MNKMGEERMKKSIVLVTMLGIFCIFLISFSSASYNLANYSIQDHYSPGSSIYGNLNISFTNEPINSTFTDNFGNSVSLKKLLASSSNYLYSYNCSHVNCSSYYSYSNPGVSKSFTMNSGESRLLGFVLTGNVTGIKNFSLSLNSDAAPLNSSQISVDLLDNGVSEFKNTKAGSLLKNEETFGCFNSSNQNIQEASISSSSPYCERVTLPDSPNLDLGLWVKETKQGNANISMTLYNNEGNLLGSCIINNSQISSSGNKTFCNLNQSVSSGEYYVCSALKYGSGAFNTKLYSSSNGTCGFLGTPVRSETAAYEIGAIPFGYTTPGEINLTNKFGNNQDAVSLIQGYINQNYPKGCTDGCYIPLKIISSEKQSVTVNNVDLAYSTVSSFETHLSKIYDFRSQVSNINSSYQRLYLDNYFKIPGFTNEIGYVLSFDGKQLFGKNLYYESIPLDVSPLIAASNLSTNFSVLTPNNYSVSSFSWDFGDNSSAISMAPYVSHKYKKIGNYNLVLSFYVGNNLISKSFSVQVVSAKNFINTELPLKRKELSSFKSSLDSLSPFEKSQIESAVGLSNIESKINSLNKMNLSASNDSEYESILNQIIGLSIPTSISKLSSGNSPFVTDSKSIDLNLLSKITKYNYSTGGNATNYASYWDYNNLDSELYSQIFSVQKEDGSSLHFSFYNLSIKPKPSINQSYYLVFPNSQGLNFENGSGIVNEGSYSYVSLGAQEKSISFSTSQSQEPNFFISPKNVEINSNPINPTKNNTLLWIVLSLAGVLLVGLIVYFILDKWYGSKYEKFLFPDKNQLYNAIVYISNSIKNGMTEKDIRKSLMDVGWKGEQITYLMKKYAGKRTGMVDIFGVSNNKNLSPPKPGMNSNYDKVSHDTKFNK